MKYFGKILFIILIFNNVCTGQNTNKNAIAVRTSTPPKIDGNLQDSAWAKTIPVSDFIQYHPLYKAAPTQKTEVKILYDDDALYVAAELYDSAPDSIFMQLGNRDSDLNADKFKIAFDTYNTGSDAYIFTLTSSGVQGDYRQNDASFNAVWESKVKVNNYGWVAEIKIPYAALRFPIKKSHIFGLQMYREIRRSREQIMWAPEEKGASSPLEFWGKLSGIENIIPPLRLSITPFLSTYLEHYPRNNSETCDFSKSTGGGLDLKYGLNESFTIDMSLLPDFSQVQTDSYIKNITPFETVYSEQRPFFTEAVDIFQKGNIFYSRRIGQVPLKYEEVKALLKPDEKIIENPGQSKLINALKLSGRNKKGLAIGFFNALTNKSYAFIKDSSGNVRKYLTDPLSNYNILVFDKTLKNNSDVYIINTNVSRNKGFYDANVTACGIAIKNKNQSWQFNADGSLSHRYGINDSAVTQVKSGNGIRYNIGLYKIKGNFHIGIWNELVDKNYSANDMGVTFTNNYNNYGVSMEYNFYDPFWKFMNMNNSIKYFRTLNLSSSKPSDSQFIFNHNATFKNYFTYWVGYAGLFEKIFDYYEPRKQGYFLIQHPYNAEWIGFSSDYRKKFAFDFETTYATVSETNFKEYRLYIQPILKLTNHLSINHKIALDKQFRNYGFVAIDSTGNVLIGNRNISTLENIFDCNYIFVNDLSLSLRVRHYWSIGTYNNYFILNSNGYLSEYQNYKKNHDFNYNSFTIDLIFNWQFAQGSNLSIVWKNSILKDENTIIKKFYDNFERLIKQDQLNSISLKLIYYLDYLKIKKLTKHHD